MSYKKLKILFSFILFISSPIFANPFVDVYGTDEETANKIIEKYGDEINHLARYAVQIRLENKPDTSKMENLAEAKKKIIAGINELKDFHSISFSTVDYYDTRLFTTVDVIEKNDHKRLVYFENFVQKKDNNIKSKKDKNIDKLLAQWDSYEEIGNSLIRKGIQLKIQSDGFFHCLYGFEDEQLKPFKKIFENGVSKNKEKLIKTLRFDPDEQRRGNTAFLLGHIKDSTELVKILTPSMLDPSSHVRNNVMRVLGSTFMIAKQSDFDILPVIKMLDSPTLTDRNKALYMLIGLTDNPKHKHCIIEHADKSLMAALKMKQPNLHDNVYELLKKMSGQNYDERDYIAWQNWLDQEKLEAPARRSA